MALAMLTSPSEKKDTNWYMLSDVCFVYMCLRLLKLAG